MLKSKPVSKNNSKKNKTLNIIETQKDIDQAGAMHVSASYSHTNLDSKDISELNKEVKLLAKHLKKLNENHINFDLDSSTTLGKILNFKITDISDITDIESLISEFKHEITKAIYIISKFYSMHDNNEIDLEELNQFKQLDSALEDKLHNLSNAFGIMLPKSVTNILSSFSISLEDTVDSVLDETNNSPSNIATSAGSSTVISS